jgi:LmbE family N-acetylglucosaminyl deacetylase
MSDDRKTVLAFFAHPDDAEFLCAGTLAKLQARGCGIHIATMTAGDGGSVELEPEVISRIRLKEAAQAAAVLDGFHHCAGMKDLLLAFDVTSLLRVIEIVRRVIPVIVLTHSPADYLTDHEITAQLVRAACFAASVPNIKTEAQQPAPAITSVPHLYYADALEGKDIFGQPVPTGFYIDVSDVLETKERMLSCHASQREWLKRQHGMDQYIESMKSWARQRGAEVGVNYAETFRQHLGHAYPQNNILAEIIGIRQKPEVAFPAM